MIEDIEVTQIFPLTSLHEALVNTLGSAAPSMGALHSEISDGNLQATKAGGDFYVSKVEANQWINEYRRRGRPS